MTIQVEPVVSSYFAGKVVNRNQLRAAFAVLGEETKALRAKDEDFPVMAAIEKMVFKKRDELATWFKTEHLPEEERVSYLINELIKTDGGNIFFYDVVLPLYRPFIHIQAERYFKGQPDVDDLESAIVFGRHSALPLGKISETGQYFNYGGSLFSCAMQYSGDSNFHTYLHTAIKFTSFNWISALKKRALAISNLAVDGETIDDVTDRLIEPVTVTPHDIAGSHDELTHAVNYWQELVAQRPLPQQRREILTLLMQGLSQEEVAAHLKMNPQTFRSNLFAIRTTLRAAIATGKDAHRLDGAIDNTTALHGLLLILANHDSHEHGNGNGDSNGKGSAAEKHRNSNKNSAESGIRK